MNIVLVGFMATGKTEVAKRLSEVLGLKYISTDKLIEERLGKTINEVFSQHGEKYFRDIEKEIVKEVSELENFIIDAGGGVMLNEENIKDLKKKGIIICLQAKPEAILERLKDKNDRPLLNTEDKLKRIRKLQKERAKHYRKADYSIDTSNLKIEEIVAKVREILKLASQYS